ncbi:unnamed protein product [Blepharisma stoltei]|uniref:Uncharacterized protein n=1 Tax=Blepharisma stoltei TaxID=1481888 RepID=A0AAU9K3Q8_9CILI|nr:unnamed protein product [Blepharisma stoltei]
MKLFIYIKIYYRYLQIFWTLPPKCGIFSACEKRIPHVKSKGLHTWKTHFHTRKKIPHLGGKVQKSANNDSYQKLGKMHLIKLFSGTLRRQKASKSTIRSDLVINLGLKN